MVYNHEMTKNSWLEVSLTVNGELAEAIADVLARFAPNGVMTEQAVKFMSDEDEGTPAGPIAVRAYLPVDEKIEETRQKVEQALFYLSMIEPLPSPVFTLIADQNWMEAWKANFHPIPVGEKLIIVPAWLESPDPSRLPIRIDPGMAFGTGTHPTTQLCLELVEEVLRDDPPHALLKGKDSVTIDVGCGSGILSIAAIKLGMKLALGVDIDEAAITASRENARANGVDDEQFILGVGSVAEIRSGHFSSTAADLQGIRNAPLVLANILAPVLIRLFDEGLADLVEPGGALILSGILQDQAGSVLVAAKAKGLELVKIAQMGDWVAILVKS